MSIFDIFRSADINAGVEECASAEGAYLVDVRTPEEYKAGHIEGSVNIPLSSIGIAASVIPDKSAPLYVYCFSGARSRYAARALKRSGYVDVNDIGGIISYKGKVVV